MSEDDPPNHGIIRRRGELARDGVPAPFTSSLIPPQDCKGRIFDVHSEVVWPAVTEDGALRGPPQVWLEWRFHPGLKGTIVGFRREGSIGKDGDYGEQIVHTGEDGYILQDHLRPGTYYYTFCTLTNRFFWKTYSNEVRVVQSVPSVEEVLKIVQQAIELKKREKEYRDLVAKPEPKPAVESQAARLNREMEEAFASIDHHLERTRRLGELWERKRKEINESDEPQEIKDRQLRSLDGAMRDLREKLKV